MADAGALIGHLGSLPDSIKRALTNYTNEWVKGLRFGAPSSSAVSSKNFGGNLVPFTTAAGSGDEVAVAHGLGRVPRYIHNVLDPGTVNATLVPLTVTRAADSRFLYLSSTVTGAFTHVFVE